MLLSLIIYSPLGTYSLSDKDFQERFSKPDFEKDYL